MVIFVLLASAAYAESNEIANSSILQITSLVEISQGSTKRADLVVVNQFPYDVNYTLSSTINTSTEPGWVFYLPEFELLANETMESQMLFDIDNTWEPGMYAVEFSLDMDGTSIATQPVILHVFPESTILLDSSDIADDAELSRSFYLILTTILAAMLLTFYFSLKVYIH